MLGLTDLQLRLEDSKAEEDMQDSRQTEQSEDKERVGYDYLDTNLPSGHSSHNDEDEFKDDEEEFKGFSDSLSIPLKLENMERSKGRRSIVTETAMHRLIYHSQPDLRRDLCPLLNIKKQRQ